MASSTAQPTSSIERAWPGGIATASFAGTDPGRVRENNQDSHCLSPNIGLFFVADGMGGRAGGEVASLLAVQSVEQNVSQHLEQLKGRELPERRSFFSQTINKASLRIYERSLELPQYRGMGTTSTLLWVPPGNKEKDPHCHFGIVAHVGDSRCYLLRSGLLFQLTDDHSLVNEQIKAGILSPSDPLIDQMKNVITRCVGYQEEEEVDTWAIPLFREDKFLICSDGLSNKVSDEEIRLMMQNQFSEKLPDRLIKLANERGGDDNITVVLVKL